MATATATALDAARSHRRGQVYVALAALAWSSAGVLQRGLSVNAATQVAVRAAFAGVALLLWVAISEHGRVGEACSSGRRAGIAFPGCVATASGAFIVALNHTTVAHVLFIQAMAPVLAALLAWVQRGEPVSTRTGVAMAVAPGAGALPVGALIWGAPGGGSLLGDGLSRLMALSFAVSIAGSRRRRDVAML